MRAFALYSFIGPSKSLILDPYASLTALDFSRGSLKGSVRVSEDPINLSEEAHKRTKRSERV